MLRPSDITWVAHKVGVGRGTDLVLYLLVLAVSFFALNTYMRFRSLEQKVTDLARAVALQEAVSVNTDRLLDADPESRVRQPAEPHRVDSPS